MSFAHGLRPEFRFPNGLYHIIYRMIYDTNVHIYDILFVFSKQRNETISLLRFKRTRSNRKRTFLTTREAAWYSFGSVCLCVCQTMNSKTIGLESSFWV